MSFTLVVGGATIASCAIVGTQKAIDAYYSESEFEAIIRTMNRAARRNRNVVKSGGGFYFFHADYWEEAFKTPEGVDGVPKPDATNKRVTRLTPQHGWVWNNWKLKVWDKSIRAHPRVSHIGTDECKSLFKNRFQYGQLARLSKKRDKTDSFA